MHASTYVYASFCWGGADKNKIQLKMRKNKRKYETLYAAGGVRAKRLAKFNIGAYRIIVYSWLIRVRALTSFILLGDDVPRMLGYSAAYSMHRDECYIHK